MPDPPDQNPPQHSEKPTSSYLAVELGALWAFLSSRHPPDGDPEPAPSRHTTKGENLTRQQLETELAERAWQDATFRAALLADPTATLRRVLATHGITLPEGVSVAVHEESPSQIHLVLPSKPPASVERFDDDASQ